MPRWQVTFWLLLLTAAVVLPPARAPGESPPQGTAAAAAESDARRARTALAKGAKAEAGGNWEEALGDYEEASRAAPRDIQILRKREAARAWAVRSHEDLAERLVLEGQMQAAQDELRAALKLDPANTFLRERQVQIRALPEGALQSGPLLGRPPRLKIRPGTHSFNIRGDTRSAYQEVAEAFGVVAAFDPDVVSRPVRLRVNDVDFDATMLLMAAQTSTFWVAVDATTFFVAPATLEKRRELAPVVEQTFVLSDAVSAEEATEMLRAVREITGAKRIGLDNASHSITIKDAPQTVALAGELIRQLAQGPGEVLLEIEILEVDRNWALQLGLTPPSQAKIYTVSPSQISALEKAITAKDSTTVLSILEQILGAAAAFNGLSGSQLASAAGTAGIGSVLPPFLVFGGGNSIFLATLPGTAANFFQALSHVRDGRRVLLRAQEDKPATFFVGERFPVSLSLLSASIGTGTNIPTLGASAQNAFLETDFTVGTDPVALASGDFNSDGQADLAVVNQKDDSVSILLNEAATLGEGQFALTKQSPIVLAPPATGVTRSATGIGSADFNGDGVLDLAVTNTSSTTAAGKTTTTNNVTILFGNGDGTFQSPGTSFAVGNGPTAIAVGQFNSKNDAFQDIAVVNSMDDTLTVLLGDNKGNFTSATGSPFSLSNGFTGTPPSTPVPCGITSADFNGDGLPDLAVVCANSNNVSVLLGQGDGTFKSAPGSPIAVGDSPVAVASGNFKGDRQPDLAVVNQTSNNMTVLLNNVANVSGQEGTFTAAKNSPVSTGNTPSGVAATTLGNLATTLSNVPTATPSSVAALAVTNFGDNTISIFLSDGAGDFAQPANFGLPFKLLSTAVGPSSVLVANFRGLGLVDLAVTDETSNTVSVILPPTNLTGSTSAAEAQEPYPSSEYLDIGLKVKATPTLHANGDVTLHLEFEIRALTGDSENGIPIVSNRTTDQTVRLKEDRTAIVARLLDQQETRSVAALPGLLNVPGISNNQGQSQDAEILILVTPRLLRLPPHKVQQFYAGRGESGEASYGSIQANPPPSGQPAQQPLRNQPPVQPGPPVPREVPPSQPSPGHAQ
jgi:type II secretory pathway component GspD/PulD (secretin)